MKSFTKDERAGAMVFSALMMLVLILFVAHTINVSDLTAEKIKVQDAADATVYSGTWVRANLYNAMGFLNMVKVALYRLRFNNSSDAISDGQWAILANFAQLVPGFDMAYGNGFDKETWVGMSTSAILRLARQADQAQLSIANNFSDIITQEMNRVAEAHGVGKFELQMGLEPVFDQISVPTYEELYPPPDYTLRPDYYSFISSNYRGFEWFCYHVADLAHWIEPMPMGCAICDPYQTWADDEYSASGPDLWTLLRDPWDGFPFPRILGHLPSPTDNTLKTAVWKDRKISILFPDLFSNPEKGMWGYASAGAFTDAIMSLDSYWNLYVTDFKAKLLSLAESSFFRNLGSQLPELPPLPEEYFVH